MALPTREQVETAYDAVWNALKRCNRLLQNAYYSGLPREPWNPYLAGETPRLYREYLQSIRDLACHCSYDVIDAAATARLLLLKSDDRPEHKAERFLTWLEVGRERAEALQHCFLDEILSELDEHYGGFPVWMPEVISDAHPNRDLYCVSNESAEYYNHLEADLAYAGTAGFHCDGEVGYNVRLERAALLAYLEQTNAKPTANAHKPPTGGNSELDDWVTLDQAAAMAGVSKRTLERYSSEGGLPEPDRRGGGGKPNLWKWSRIRPALQEHFRPDLPVRFPGSRIH